MAAPDLVGGGVGTPDALLGVANTSPIASPSRRGRPAYLPARRLGPGLRLGAHSLGRREDEPDEVIPGDEDAVPPPIDPDENREEVRDGDQEEDEAEDDSQA